jgi:hypothetical protein
VPVAHLTLLLFEYQSLFFCSDSFLPVQAIKKVDTPQSTIKRKQWVTRIMASFLTPVDLRTAHAI